MPEPVPGMAISASPLAEAPPPVVVVFAPALAPPAVALAPVLAPPAAALEAAGVVALPVVV